MGIQHGLAYEVCLMSPMHRSIWLGNYEIDRNFGHVKYTVQSAITKLEILYYS
jgi:hypothetical protein